MRLDSLNSGTKYPSILTYHELRERGRIPADALPQVSFDGGGGVLVTEKIDGTNGRIVVLPGRDYFIGSREEFLTARRDRIYNPAMGIVAALSPLAENLMRFTQPEILIVFLEVYGGKVGGNAKHYSTTGRVGFRVFDVARCSTDIELMSAEQAASWRDGGGQRFMDEDELKAFCSEYGIELAPRIEVAEPLPSLPGDVANWLNQSISTTQVGLDAHGQAEGVVVRTSDRSRIAKIRFDDYKRIIK